MAALTSPKTTLWTQPATSATRAPSPGRWTGGHAGADVRKYRYAKMNDEKSTQSAPSAKTIVFRSATGVASRSPKTKRTCSRVKFAGVGSAGAILTNAASSSAA